MTDMLLPALASLLAGTPSPSPDDVADLTAGKAAQFWDWFTGWPAHVLAILVIGGFALVLVRRTISHITERIANGYHRAYVETAVPEPGPEPPGAPTGPPGAATPENTTGPRSGLRRGWRRTKHAVMIEDALGLVTPEVKQRRAQRARTVGSVLSSAANIVIATVMGLMILAAVGAGDVVTPLLASAGVVGVAVGFGAQSLVRDFLSGIFILIEDQFGVGDEVDLGAGAVGIVERVDLRLTRVRSFDGTLWHVRNGEILRAGNHTQQWARAVAKVAVPVGSDIGAVRAALGRAVDTVCTDPALAADMIEAPSVRGVDALGDGTYTFTLHGRVRPGTDGEVTRALLAQAQRELVASGIIVAAVNDDDEVPGGEVPGES